MAVLETVDGRLLRSRPAGLPQQSAWGMFPPMWSDGERWGPDGPGTDVMKSYAAIYRSQPVLAGAVDKLAHRIATLPFDGYQELGEDKREVVRGDSLDDLLRSPMPRRGKVFLLHGIAQSLLLNGNAVVAKVPGDDPDLPPKWLWLLDWSHLSAYADAGLQVEWWSTTQFGGGEKFIPAERVLHFTWQAPDGEIGVSPLEKLGVTVRLDEAITAHQTAQFRNGLRPSSLVTLPEKTTKPNLELTRAELEGLHKGPHKAGKVAFAAPGADWKTLQITAVEAALIDQRRLNREEVGMVYDLSGPLMNDLTHGTYSNVQELNTALYRDVVPPWLAMIQETFGSQLLDEEPTWQDRSLRFDLSDKLKGDPVQLAQTLKIEVEAGLRTRNEARKVLNLPPDPSPEANELTLNANNQAPLERAADVPPPPDLPAPDDDNPPRRQA